MKRMFLVSMFQTVSNLLKTIEPDLKNKTVTYIPTASKVEKLGFFVKISKWKLKRLGLAVDEFDADRVLQKITARGHAKLAEEEGAK